MPTSKLLWSLPVLRHGTWLTHRGDATVRLDAASGAAWGWTRRPLLAAEPFDVPFELSLLLRAAQLSYQLGLRWSVITGALPSVRCDLAHWAVLENHLIVHVFTRSSFGIRQDELIAIHHGRFLLEREMEERYAPATSVIATFTPWTDATASPYPAPEAPAPGPAPGDRPEAP